MLVSRLSSSCTVCRTSIRSRLIENIRRNRDARWLNKVLGDVATFVTFHSDSWSCCRCSLGSWYYRVFKPILLVSGFCKWGQANLIDLLTPFLFSASPWGCFWLGWITSPCRRDGSGLDRWEGRYRRDGPRDQSRAPAISACRLSKVRVEDRLNYL